MRVRGLNQDNAVVGAIHENRGTYFLLTSDGNAWFASFDRVSGDTDPMLNGFRRLDKHALVDGSASTGMGCSIRKAHRRALVEWLEKRR